MLGVSQSVQVGLYQDGLVKPLTSKLVFFLKHAFKMLDFEEFDLPVFQLLSAKGEKPSRQSTL